jgi:hypothetical protein
MKTRRKGCGHYFDNLKREKDIGLLGNECRFLVKTFYIFQNEVKLIHFNLLNIS